MKHLPLKACEKCGCDYRPTRSVQRYCRVSCFHETLKTKQKGLAPTAATRALAESTKARSRARIKAEFGELSEREIALMKLALARGYQKGYHKARTDNRREVA